MSYSPGTLRTKIPALAGGAADVGSARRDLRVSQFAHFLAAAGWSIREIGCEFVVTTNGTAGSMALAGNSTYIFWKIDNLATGSCVLVGDVPSVIADLSTKCNACGGIIFTGTNDAVATHAGVVRAILCLGIGENPVPITSTSTRFTSSRAASAAISMNIGGQLNTTIILPPSQGGYVCRSQPSTKQVLVSGVPVKYGEGVFNPCKLKKQGRPANRENFVELYIHNSKNTSNRAVYWQGAKEFKARPADSTIVTSGTTTDGTEVCIIDGLTYIVNNTTATPFGTFDALVGTDGSQNMPDIHAWANPYGVFAYSRSLADSNKYPSMFAGALKLFDCRLIPGIGDLPITEATFITYSLDAANPGTSWARAGNSSGLKRFCLNGDAKFSSGIFDKGSPQFFLWGGAAVQQAYARWVNNATVMGEPWFGFNPYNEVNRGPILGQIWDAATIAEITTFLTLGKMPPDLPLFQWDNQPWRRVNEVGQSSNQAPFTLALRETGYWDAGQIIA